VKTVFNYGKSAIDLLNEAIETEAQMLLTPDEDRYIGFSWTELNEEGTDVVAGSTDLRLICCYGEKKNLKIFSNTGSLPDGTKEILDDIIGDTNYPIFAEDRYVFRWENTKFKEEHTD
jgi:hypothetical protein